MPRLDRPGTAGDGRRGVDHGEVELRPLREHGRTAAPDTASARARRPSLGAARRLERRLGLPRRDTSTAAQPLLDHLRSKRGCELRHLAEQRCACRALSLQLRARSLWRPYRASNSCEQGDEHSARLLPRAVRNRLRGCEAPREIGCLQQTGVARSARSRATRSDAGTTAASPPVAAKLGRDGRAC